MSNRDVEVCPVCKGRHLVRITRELSFRQVTDKGRVNCSIGVPVGTCTQCGFQMLDGDAQAMLDQAVRREYDKLPSPPERDN